MILMPYECERQRLDVAVDADFAGCRETRRSTCGGCVHWGRALIKAWSKTLATMALSTGESELGALVKGATEGLGVQAILADFALNAKIGLHSDASAAIGITSRRGLGKVRHLAVADLWIQQRVQRGDFEIQKLPGLENPADLMTKILATGEIRSRLESMNMYIGE